MLSEILWYPWCFFSCLTSLFLSRILWYHWCFYIYLDIIGVYYSSLTSLLLSRIFWYPWCLLFLLLSKIVWYLLFLSNISLVIWTALPWMQSISDWVEYCLMLQDFLLHFQYHWNFMRNIKYCLMLHDFLIKFEYHWNFIRNIKYFWCYRTFF